MSAKKKAPPMKARRKNDGPRTKGDGGSRTADGIRISPGMQSRFDAAMEMTESVNEILAFQQRLAGEMLMRAKKLIRELFQEAAENYDIDLSEGWRYRRSTGELIRTPDGPKTLSPEATEAK